MNSLTEENYLKAIYKLSRKTDKGVSTNSIAGAMNTKPSSATDMIKKLAAKKLINYQKYQGVVLTKSGRADAINIIRKHRLWEVFLVENLGFKWDAVHEIAEQLEHIKSQELIDRLDKYLKFPKYDPHGDPIPDKDGNIHHHKEMCLNDLEKGDNGIVVGVKDSSSSFLKYLEKMSLLLGTKIHVNDRFEFDQSLLISTGKEEGEPISISETVAKNLYIKKQ